jgi:hypothetical protein
VSNRRNARTMRRMQRQRSLASPVGFRPALQVQPVPIRCLLRPSLPRPASRYPQSLGAADAGSRAETHRDKQTEADKGAQDAPAGRKPRSPSPLRCRLCSLSPVPLAALTGNSLCAACARACCPCEWQKGRVTETSVCCAAAVAAANRPCPSLCFPSCCCLPSAPATGLCGRSAAQATARTHSARQRSRSRGGGRGKAAGRSAEGQKRLQATRLSTPESEGMPLSGCGSSPPSLSPNRSPLATVLVASMERQKEQGAVGRGHHRTTPEIRWFSVPIGSPPLWLQHAPMRFLLLRSENRRGSAFARC